MAVLHRQRQQIVSWDVITTSTTTNISIHDSNLAFVRLGGGSHRFKFFIGGPSTAAAFASGIRSSPDSRYTFASDINQNDGENYNNVSVV